MQRFRNNPESQEFGSSRAIWLIALAIAIAESALFLLAFSKNVATSFSDPDDAMRLVQVRELLQGKSWYDQWISRVNPPDGLYMHWSRLVDGAEAGMISLAQLFMSHPGAEIAVREIWPLLWILPATVAALFFARNLGGRYSILICATLLVMDILIFRQFRPGRLDHHNIQITLAMIAVAMASRPDASWKRAALAGVASGLGLAVGLEGLPILAAVGVSFAARLLWLDQRQAAISYGIALAASTTMLFLIQTPPARWLLPFCDALAINLVAGIVVLGLGLAAIALHNVKAPLNFVLMGLAGLLGAGVYFGIHPACLAGGFGDSDPRLQAIWLDFNTEVLPVTQLFKYSAALAIHPLAMAVELTLAALILWRKDRWTIPVLLVILLSLAIVPAAIRFAKFQDYLFWVGVPAFSAAASKVASRFGATRLVAVIASIGVAPASFSIAAQALQPKSSDHTQALAFPADCGSEDAYQKLSRSKPGLVLADISLGPNILAYTKNSVVGAPYHRLSRQIVEIYELQRAAPSDARKAIRKLQPAYLVDCKGLPDVDHGLFHELRAGSEFSWLERLSPHRDAIQIWRVRAP